jgi:nucleoside-diphosphate-sugar epimerase
MAFDPRELNSFLPGPSPRLAYLKCRWACEQVLLRASEAARIPVNIIHTSMYNKAGRPLNKSDITRRILAALLLGGSVSGFNSKNGGGMSWLSIDYLVSAMVALYNGGGKRDVPKICISKARSIFYTGIG